MKCWICDKGMDDVSLDPRDMKPRHCSECELEIQECLDGYEDPEEDTDETVPEEIEFEDGIDLVYPQRGPTYREDGEGIEPEE